MNSQHLEDRLRWGMNIAARATGSMTSVFRPSGPDHPLATGNRFLRFLTAFAAVDGKFNRANQYGNALWRGIFDSSYTRPGDYLVQDHATWFVAEQPRLMPTLCVRTNQVISFFRPATPSTSGVNGYGGVTATSLMPIMTGWPASVLATTREGRSFANLPGDTPASVWTVLVPAAPGIILRSADLMSDDLGRNGVIATTELTERGWRLVVRQATT